MDCDDHCRGVRGSLDGTNTGAQLSGPTAIAIDSATNLYVSDEFNFTIRKLSPMGTNWVVTTIAGQAGVTGTNDGANHAAQFNDPTGIAIDAAGNLFVADEFNNAIRKISWDGANWNVRTLAGGSQGSADGTNSAAEFFYPTGLAVDTNDRVFVADYFNNSIRMLTPIGSNWVVTTIAGQTTAGSSNGLGTNALFYLPTGIAVDTNEKVYVSDLFSVREMTPSGTNWLVSTIGGGTQGFQDGTGSSAQFHLPFGMTVDSYGDLFVADSLNNAIRLGLSSSSAPQLGSLQVILTPADAVGAGAQWQLDGGGLQASGATLSDLSPGIHTITFGNVSGYNTPAYQTVTVTAHQTTMASGNYPTAIPNAGSLEVLMAPDAAIADGAQWQVDGGPLQTNGAIAAGLSIGSHTLSFYAVPGWSTPGTQTIIITNSETTLGIGTYEVETTNYTITVSASPSTGGTVTGGGTFLSGSAQTLTATAASGYVFTNWTLDGNVISLASNYSVEVGGNETLVANFLPLYTLTVTASPNSGGTVSGGGTNFTPGSTSTVTAIPNSGFEFVSWTGQGTGTNSPTQVTIYTNLNLTANFAPTGSLTVSVFTNGEGTVSPNMNGKILKAGSSYALRATPKTGYVFSNWTGSITTNKNPLNVKVETTVVLQANFIPNPFLPVKGTYNGLFATTNGVTLQTAGMLKSLAIGQTGTYSGAILINGGAHSITGVFDLAGAATNKISRPANQGGSLVVEMVLSNLDNTGPQVTGTVSGTNDNVPWVANLFAEPAPPSLPASEHTMLLAPDPTNEPPSLSPGGYSYVAINYSAGLARMTGALADGTALSQSVPVSESGDLPVYSSLYSGKGLLLGWINLEAMNTDSVGLTWIHPQRTSGLYQGGFTNILAPEQILLSRWTNSPPNLGLLTNLSLLGAVTGTNAVDFTIGTATRGTITGPSVAGSINLKTGTFKVTTGSGAGKITSYGAILLNTTNGGGYFLTKTNAQAVELNP